MRFVNKDELLKADLPMIPEEFEALVKKQCADAREVLTKWYVLSILCACAHEGFFVVLFGPQQTKVPLLKVPKFNEVPNVTQILRC